MRHYIQMVVDLTTRLVVEHGAEVHFISTCQGIPEYWTDDSDIASHIASLLSPHVATQVRVDRQPYSTDVLCDFYASCDLVVATRMHAAILAMCGGTPVLPIVYEYKTEELAKEVRLDRWMVNIESSSSAELVEKCDDLLHRLNDAAAAMRDSVKRLALEAHTTGDVVRSALSAEKVWPSIGPQGLAVSRQQSVRPKRGPSWLA